MEPLTRDTSIIMVDGGYLYRCIQPHFPKGNEPELAERLYHWLTTDLMREVSQSCMRELNLKEIRYYDCRPYSHPIFNPYTRERIATHTTYRDKLLHHIGQYHNVILRLGRLVVTGWEPRLKKQHTKQLVVNGTTSLSVNDFSPSFQQKEVDIHIAQDLCSMIQSEDAGTMIAITDDSDFKPLFDTARQEGICVVLVNLRNNPKRVAVGLLNAVDYLVTPPWKDAI